MRNASSWIAEEHPRMEARCGEPLRAFLPSLSPSGATGAVLASQVSGLGSLLLRHRANKAGGDAASFKTWKQRYGLLVITAEGRVKLWRTKRRGRDVELEALVGNWSLDDVEIEFSHGRGLIKIGIRPRGEPGFAFEYISALGGASELVSPFAQAAGVPFAA